MPIFEPYRRYPAPDDHSRNFVSRLLWNKERLVYAPLTSWDTDWEEDSWTLTRVGTIVLIVISTSVIGGVFYLARSLFGSLARQWSGLWTFLSSSWVIGFGTVALVAAGSLLYILRTRRRTLYGIFEFSFAVVVTWISVGKWLQGAEAAAIGVIQAAYLIVRGLDNIMEGRKRSRTVP
jgi:hypothetical protein